MRWQTAACLRRLQIMSSVAPAPVPLAVPHSIYLGRGGQQCSPPANRPHPPWPSPDPALAQLSLVLSLLVSTRRCMCCVRVGHPSRDARRRLYAVSHRDTCKQLQAVSPERRSGQPHKTMEGTLRSLQSRPCSRPTAAQLPHLGPCRAASAASAAAAHMPTYWPSPVRAYSWVPTPSMGAVNVTVTAAKAAPSSTLEVLSL